jgi:hypothetical protein
MGNDTNVGERFVAALAAKDRDALTGLLQPDVDFRALTPSRFWEANDAATVVDDTMLGHWFEPQDVITEVIETESGRVGRRARLRYRLAVTSPDGPHVVEQQAYYETDGERISWLRIMCAGYLPADEGPVDEGPVDEASA